MKISTAKKFLVASLSVALVLAPAMTVCATGQPEPPAPAPVVTPDVPVYTPSAPAQTSPTQTAVEQAQAQTKAATTVTVAGTTMTTNVAGTVILDAASDIKGVVLQGSGGAGEKQTVFSSDRKSSPQSFASADGAAATQGLEVKGDALNCDIKLNGEGKLTVVVTVPLTASAKIIAVGPGGVTKLIDPKVEGNSITFAPLDGHWTYFIADK